MYEDVQTWLRNQDDEVLVEMSEISWDDADDIEPGTQDRWRDLATTALVAIFVEAWTVCPLYETVDAAQNWAAADYSVGLAQSACDVIALNATSETFPGKLDAEDHLRAMAVIRNSNRRLFYEALGYDPGKDER